MRRGFSFVVAMFVLLATMGAAAEGRRKRAPKAAAAITTPININTATAAQFEALPGIGVGTARPSSTTARKKNSRSEMKMVNVKGIERSLLKLEPMVTVSVDELQKSRGPVEEATPGVARKKNIQYGAGRAHEIQSYVTNRAGGDCGFTVVESSLRLSYATTVVSVAVPVHPGRRRRSGRPLRRATSRDGSPRRVSCGRPVRVCRLAIRAVRQRLPLRRLHRRQRQRQRRPVAGHRPRRRLAGQRQGVFEDSFRRSPSAS